MTRALDNLNEIRDVAASLLRKASADERLPTPVDDLVAASDLMETDDYFLSESKISQAPREIRNLLRTAGRKIRGLLDRQDRILHVSPDTGPAQRQFVRCHEVMHNALPWQRDLLLLGDTSQTLAPSVEWRFEREANQGGAELLFQLDLLERIARDYPIEIATPVALASMFGASIHATFRRWIEQHAGTMCGIVLDPTPLTHPPFTFRRFEVIESSGWTQRYRRSLFPQQMTAQSHTFLAALEGPWALDIDCGWAVHDKTGTITTVRVQSFSNGYKNFVLLWQPGQETFVARHRARRRLLAS